MLSKIKNLIAPKKLETINYFKVINCVQKLKKKLIAALKNTLCVSTPRIKIDIVDILRDESVDECTVICCLIARDINHNIYMRVLTTKIRFYSLVLLILFETLVSDNSFLGLEGP